MLTDQSNHLNQTGSSGVSLRERAKVGLWGGFALLLVSVMGIVETFAGRTIIDTVLSMGYLLLALLVLGTGFMAAKPPPQLEGERIQKAGPKNVLAGLIAALIASSFLAALILVASQLEDIRSIFLNISPPLLELLTFGQSVMVGTGLLIVTAAILGATGAVIHLISKRWRSSLLMASTWMLTIGVLEDTVNQILRQIGLASLKTLFYKGTGGLTILGASILWVLFFALYYFVIAKRANIPADQKPERTQEQRRKTQIRLLVSVIIVMGILPLILGSANTEILDKVGLALLMGLGLNIVVGFAGLLDLGYVAFFAVGAYTMTVFTSPSSPLFAPELSFWLALPFVVIMATIAGIFVGTPVLRMRGDYLAIVTLGFGEIASIISKSEWFRPILGGAQGILSVPNIFVGPLAIHKPQEIYYPILGFILLAAYISIRLQDSRIGRAWVAMREDEPVAEVMGVNIVTAKLLAFIIGAILASFSGALFATKIGSVFPSSFDLAVSIQILVLIIIGGIGNILGVVVGAFAIVGLPELLKEFDQYREFFYGVILILMMRIRPEGLLPSTRRARELHEDDASQDAWVQSEAAASD
ncbi:MAG: branched-chain amino acid ABC transporter permease [Chloroflexi bacterium]|nr:branched-chain amino acid ABC transporter permease [Chloroflexota bacterium]